MIEAIKVMWCRVFHREYHHAHIASKSLYICRKCNAERIRIV